MIRNALASPGSGGDLGEAIREQPEQARLALTLAAAGSLLALPGLAGQVLDVVSSPVFLVLGAGCVGWLVFHRKGGEGK